MRSVLVLVLFMATLMGEQSSFIRMSSTTMTINESGKGATWHVKQVFDISDKNGEDLAEIVIPVNEYSSLEKVLVQVFNAKGKRKKKFKKKHFEQIEASASGTIASGDLYYYLDASSVIPTPFIVEVEYELDISSLFFWPAWSPQANFPVKEATYTVNIPDGIQFSSFNPAGRQPGSSSQTQYLWSYSDIEKYPDETSIPAHVFDEYTVFFTPGEFDLDGNSSKTSSWAEIGEFYWGLTKDQFTLDPASVSDLDLDSCDTRSDSIAQIYRYVQETTRYVAITLGIHGWKPHSSQSVCENKYGDCKDLSTFFISLLDLYGIKAHPVLILTRSAGKIYPEFPDTRFNHVIACVPLGGDTLWVDCTYDDASLAYLPAQDQGCNVLVVKEGESFITQTPVSPPQANQTQFIGTVSLNTAGSASIEGELTAVGSASRRYRGIFKSRSEEEQQEYIKSMFRESAPGLELESYSIENLNMKDERFVIKMQAKVPRLGSRSGKRIFTPLAFPYGVGWSGEHPARRTMPFNAGSPSIFASKISFSYPETMAVESYPRDTDIETAFGSFRSSFSKGVGQVRVEFEFKDYKPLIPIEEYSAFYEFRQQAKKANAVQLVLTKE